MRVNIYAEEQTQRVELVRKGDFTGIRFYLELPVALSTPPAKLGGEPGVTHISGPFVHKPGDDDSAAVTFWGKRAFKAAMIRALQLIDADEAPASAGQIAGVSAKLQGNVGKEHFAKRLRMIREELRTMTLNEGESDDLRVAISEVDSMRAAVTVARS